MTGLLKQGTWVLVADGEKALFLKNAGDLAHPNLEVIRQMQDDNPPTREQGADRPGRTNASTANRISAVDDTDWHRVAKERFADEIAEKLYAMAHRGDFDRLVLIVPPLVLGEMRKKLHKEVADRIVGEFAKTLTKMPVDEIEEMLKGQ